MHYSLTIPLHNAQLEDEMAQVVLSPEIPPLTINHQSISFKRFLKVLRSTGKLPMVLQELVSRYVIEQELQHRPDLAVDSAALDQAIATFRQENDLENPQSFQSWLIDQGWDEAIFREQVQFNLKLDTFKVQLAAPRLLETFMEYKFWLDQVVLSRIVVKSQDLAAELMLQITEDGVSFEHLAQDYSQADDAVTNGMMGMLSRADVQSQLGVDVYQFQPRQTVGPIAHGQDWCLLRVEKQLPAKLDDAVKYYLQEQIFQQWLTSNVQALTIDLCLSDVV